jgi:hypothetical protein
MSASKSSDAPDMLVRFIDRIHPDAIVLCKLDYGILVNRLVNELAERSKIYYSDKQNLQTPFC